MFDGKWTYRSFHNDPEEVGGDAEKALGLIFGEGIFTLEQNGNALTGTFDMGPGYALKLSGTVTGTGSDATFELQGPGIPGTATADWQYDYHGGLAWAWPNGVNQVPAIVGSVIRARPHGAGAPAGVTASFIAVSHAVIG